MKGLGICGRRQFWYFEWWGWEVGSGRKEGSSRIMFTGLGRILYGVLLLLTNHILSR